VEFELWREDPVNKRGDWTLFAVGDNYAHKLATIDPALSYEKTFCAESFEKVMQIVHSYLGLPPFVPPDFQ